MIRALSPAILLLLTAFPVAAQPAAVPIAPAIAQSRSVSLAGLYIQEDWMLEQATGMFENSFLAGFKGSDADRMEAQFPGMRDAALTAGRRTFVASYRAAVPGWKDNLSSFFADRFTPAEIDALVSFYQSDAGKKAVIAMTTDMNTDDLTRRAIAEGDGVKVQADDATTMLNMGNLGTLDQTELKAMMTFGMSPAGRKFQRLGPELQALLVKDVNQTMQAIQPDTQSAVVEAVSGHIAGFGKAK